VLSSRIDISLWTVHDNDPKLCGCLQIHIVDTNSSSSNDSQPLASSHERRRNLCFAPHNESVVVVDYLLKLLWTQTFAFVYLQGSLEHLEAIG
jgi:hypothetical protein